MNFRAYANIFSAEIECDKFWSLTSPSLSLSLV